MCYLYYKEIKKSILSNVSENEEKMKKNKEKEEEKKQIETRFNVNKSIFSYVNAFEIGCAIS